MLPTLRFDARTVFVKSAKGRDEVARRGQGLNAHARRALILVDGVKTLHELGQLFPMHDLAEILALLVREGLIEDRDSAAAPPLPAIEAAPMHGEAKTDERLRQVKDFMTITAQTYLGLLGADVIRHVELASDSTELLAAAGHWHMALHASRQGKRFATPYLEQVKNALVNGQEI
jgi:hypothetical protein